MRGVIGSVLGVAGLGLLLSGPATGPAGAAVIKVDSAADEEMGDGFCTLREAIVAANLDGNYQGCVRDATPGTDRIEFAIPGTGVQTIALTSPLGWITAPVVIDGLTQPGASCSSWPPTLLIELDGSGAGPNADGLILNAPDSMVRGLAVRGFSETGIWLHQAHRTRIQCNFVGTDASGTTAAPNLDGIFLANEVQDSFVGTDGNGRDDQNEGNLISGNHNVGIYLSGDEVTGNRISGNLIGTDVTGQASLNGAYGIILLHGAENVFGTNGDGVSDALERNVISGHTIGEAIHIENDGADRSRISGNLIGTDVDGLDPLPNGVGINFNGGIDDSVVGTNSDGISDALEGNLVAYNLSAGLRFNSASRTRIQGNRISGNGGAGVLLQFGTLDNLVGTDGDGVRDAAEGNLISGNAGSGIRVTGESAGNRIEGNSIDGNGGLGIDLDFDGVTFNDPLDADTGPNGLQNHPELSNVDSGPSDVLVVGSLHSAPGATFTLDFYVSPTCDASGRGEGAVWMGRLEGVEADGSGNATFSATLPFPVVEAASVTATAAVTTAVAGTRIGDTSEFSPCFTASGLTATPTLTPTETGTPTPSPTVTLTPTPSSTQTQTFTPTVTPTPTETATSTQTATATSTSTETRTPTSTATASVTSTATASATATETATPTSTATATDTATASPTDTPTATGSATGTATASATASPTNTPASTGTTTPTVAATQVEPGTATPTGLSGSVVAEPSGRGPLAPLLPALAAVVLASRAAAARRRLGAPASASWAVRPREAPEPASPAKS